MFICKVGLVQGKGKLGIGKNDFASSISSLTIRSDAPTGISEEEGNYSVTVCARHWEKSTLVWSSLLMASHQ